jgi:hypothetical protein
MRMQDRRMKMGTKGQKLSLLPSVILTVITLTVYLRTADFIWHSNSDYGGQKKYDFNMGTSGCIPVIYTLRRHA